jgi:hypothetical protein
MIRVISGNLLPCIILHTLFNALQSALLILEPYFTPAEVPEQTVAIMHFLN